MQCSINDPQIGTKNVRIRKQKNGKGKKKIKRNEMNKETKKQKKNDRRRNEGHIAQHCFA